jgi:hypothetical protein
MPTYSDYMVDSITDLPTNPTDLPFTVTTVVSMCWGLTLKLSHETQQEKLGNKFMEEIENSLRIDAKFRQCHSQFNMILARTMRNLAFLRQAHIRHLNRKTREYLELRDLLNSIGDIAFSKESIPLKLISFFGGGLLSISKIPFKEGVESVILFVLFGLIGIFVINILFKIGAYVYLHIKEEKLRKKQNEYYKDKYRNDMARALYNYSEDIKNLLKRFYDYTKNNTTVEDDPLLVKCKEQAEEYIKEKVLPSVEIDWDIWLSPTERLTEVKLEEEEPARPGSVNF